MNTLPPDLIEHIASMVCLPDAVALSRVSRACHKAISHESRKDLYNNFIHSYIKQKKQLFINEISLITTIPLHIVDRIDQIDQVCYDNKKMNEIIQFFLLIFSN